MPSLCFPKTLQARGTPVLPATDGGHALLFIHSRTDREEIKELKQGRIMPQCICGAREEGSVPSERSHHAVSTPRSSHSPPAPGAPARGLGGAAEPQGQGQQTGHPKRPQNVDVRPGWGTRPQAGEITPLLQRGAASPAGRDGWGLSPGAMRLAQHQQSNPRCLLSPQTGPVTPAGFVPRRRGNRGNGAQPTAGRARRANPRGPRSR